MPDIRNIIELGRRLDGLFQCRFRRNLPILHQDAGRNTDLENCKRTGKRHLEKARRIQLRIYGEGWIQGPGYFRRPGDGNRSDQFRYVDNYNERNRQIAPNPDQLRRACCRMKSVWSVSVVALPMTTIRLGPEAGR
jgi:hypothetical protein